MKAIIFIGWFILVSIWNLGWPEAAPAMDIIVAVCLSFLSILFNRLLVKNYE